MNIAILSANLGSFDTNPKDPVSQWSDKKGTVNIIFHRFTDEDFPPIADINPRFQYRIPKLFGWEMFPGHDIYIWLDAGMSLQRPDSVEWFLGQLGEADMAFFRHPWRGTVKQEVEHVEKKLQENNRYITPRYKNGLHKELHKLMQADSSFRDEHLFASNVFIYRNNPNVHEMMKHWWYYQSRYFTVDQIALSYAMSLTKNLTVNKIPDNLFKIGYISLVSQHK